MPKKRSWSIDQLKDAIKKSKSYRQVIKELGLIPAGGNYDQLKKYVQEEGLNTDHFTGKVWNKGIKGTGRTFTPLKNILVKNSTFQSYKLKNRLFLEGTKAPVCEICGWSQKSSDGRIPVELDHINGDHQDNRLENLRILCPNCHSLQKTHRGRNQKKFKKARVA